MAALVALNHIRDLVMVDASAAGRLNPAWQALYFLTGFGRIPVIVFFVLSGFFVGGKLLQLEAVNAGNVGQYLLDRFVRIYLVLLPALAVTAGLDGIGGKLFGLYQSDRWSHSLTFPIAALDTAANFWSSALNLTLYVGAPFGSNPPLWSLAYEWVIYLMFPALLLAWRGLRRGGLRPPIALGGVAALVVIVLTPQMPVLMAVWLTGALARWWEATTPKTSWISSVAAAAAFAGALIFARLHRDQVSATDLAVGFTAALFCSQRLISSWRVGRAAHRRLASFSYSLYLIHFPLAAFMLGCLQWHGRVLARLPPGAEAVSVLTGMFLIVISAAYLFSLATERHTTYIRNLIRYRRVGGRPRRP